MNREIYPAGLYPLTGDVESQAGNTGVSVVGIQNVPVQPTAPDVGNVLTYDNTQGGWVPEPLPIATTSSPGVVQPDGSTITITPAGVISSAPPTHAEPLTDGNANIIFSASLTEGGDVIVVVGVPN